MDVPQHRHSLSHYTMDIIEHGFAVSRIDTIIPVVHSHGALTNTYVWRGAFFVTVCLHVNKVESKRVPDHIFEYER